MSFLGLKMHSKTFFEIKYRHLAVFDWTIEHSLSCFSERVFALNFFLGGDAHFLYAIGGRTTPKQPITVAATMNFAFLQILLLSSGVILRLASVCPANVLHFFGQSKNDF